MNVLEQLKTAVNYFENLSNDEADELNKSCMTYIETNYPWEYQRVM